MPSKRHDQLVSFGMRILQYMGCQDIRKEEWVYVKDASGKERKYRIDVVGYKSTIDNDKGLIKDDMFLIEVGFNQHDKISNLRLGGYWVMVIPYSENEEEWQDEKVLLDIMIKSNTDIKQEFFHLVNAWRTAGELQIRKITDASKDIDKYTNELKNIREAITNSYSVLQTFKDQINKIDIPYEYRKIIEAKSE